MKSKLVFSNVCFTDLLNTYYKQYKIRPCADKIYMKKTRLCKINNVCMKDCLKIAVKSAALNQVRKWFPPSRTTKCTVKLHRCAEISEYISDSLDAIEVENRSHVLWQSHGVRPHKIICDRNYVLLTSQGRHNLLQNESSFLWVYEILKRDTT